MPIKSLKKILNLARNQPTQDPDTNTQIHRINAEVVLSEENQQYAHKNKQPQHLNQHKKNENTFEDVNQVIVWKGIHEGKQKKIYYIPAYMRVQINRVNRIDYLGCSAQIDMGIHIWLRIKELPSQLQEKIINQGQLRINGSQNVKLKDIQMRKNNTGMNENNSKYVAEFYAHKVINMEIQSDNFFSPFELINIQGKLELRHIYLQDCEVRTEVGFNFMQTDPFLHFRFNELRNLGNYELAEGRVAIKFSNQQCFGRMKFYVDRAGQLVEQMILPSFMKNKIESQKMLEPSPEISPPNSFKNATVVISLYKYPMTTMITIFIPFYLLALLCLGVFFTVNLMGTRSLSIFLLLMSYMAMIPGIRRTIPPTSSLIMVEILIYVQAICIIAIFAQSISIRNIENYVFDWQSDFSFLFVLAFTLLNFIFVMGLCFAHKCIWQPGYNRLSEETRLKLNKKFNTDNWYNDTCQLEFNQHFSQENLSTPYSKAGNKIEHRSSRKMSKKIKFVMN